MRRTGVWKSPVPSFFMEERSQGEIYALRGMAFLTRSSHQAAFHVMKKFLLLRVYANFFEISCIHAALGARSLVFSPSARTCSLKRSHHYAFSREHALRAKILRDRHAPW